jgi:hypothetical protein
VDREVGDRVDAEDLDEQLGHVLDVDLEPQRLDLGEVLGVVEAQLDLHLLEQRLCARRPQGTRPALRFRSAGQQANRCELAFEPGAFQQRRVGCFIVAAGQKRIEVVADQAFIVPDRVEPGGRGEVHAIAPEHLAREVSPAVVEIGSLPRQRQVGQE